MKLLLTVLFLIYSIHSFSQKKELPKTAVSDNDSIPSEDRSTVFRAILKSKDSLPLFTSDSLNPSIFTQINKLDDVYIKEKSEFNAVSLGIISKEIKPLSVNERRLYTAGDFKPIHLLSLLGGSAPWR